MSVKGLPAQLVDATQALNLSAGVAIPRSCMIVVELAVISGHFAV
jgi:hypothetical protein